MMEDKLCELGLRKMAVANIFKEKSKGMATIKKHATY